MEEQEIVALFWQRSEQAIAQANIKYGRLLQQLCGNILGDDRETEECVSDTLLALWNTIPPENPAPLTAYACRIARNLALKRLREKTPKSGTAAYRCRWKNWQRCSPLLRPRSSGMQTLWLRLWTHGWKV